MSSVSPASAGPLQVSSLKQSEENVVPMRRICRVVTEVFSSRVVHVLAVGAGAFAVTGSWPVVVLAGTGWGYYHRKRVSDELSTLYLERYPLPDPSHYKAIQEGRVTFFANVAPRPAIDVLGGRCAVDLVAKFDQACLYVGILPTARIAQWMKETAQVAHVVSLVEDFEYRVPGIFGKVVQEDEWSKYGVDVHRFPMVDHQVPNRDMLESAAVKIEFLLKGGKHVYVHCKVGMGRAPTTAAEALRRLTSQLAYPDIIKRLALARPQINQESLRRNPFHLDSTTA